MQDPRPHLDPIDKHKVWSKDIEETQGHAANYPAIGDSNLDVTKHFDMLPAEVAVAVGRERAVAPPDLFEVTELSPHRMIGAKRLQGGPRPPEVRVGPGSFRGDFEPRLLECGQHFGRPFMNHDPAL